MTSAIIAGWRAIKAVPIADKLFDIARQLDNLFGQSDGVLAFRAVTAELQEKSTSIVAPGGTRKIGYLSSTPGSLTSNFKVIVAGIHARLEWAKQGHGSQTQGSLVELGRLISDPALVTFALCFDDIMRRGVRPFVLSVQKGLEPDILLKCQQRLLTYFKWATSSICKLRTILTVLVLCRQHIGSVADIGFFLGLFAGTSVARCFPALFEHISDLIGTPCLFQETELQVETGIKPYEFMVTQQSD